MGDDEYQKEIVVELVNSRFLSRLTFWLSPSLLLLLTQSHFCSSSRVRECETEREGVSLSR